MVSRITSRISDPFLGDGKVRELARQVDWAATALGPVDQWSPTLRAIVRSALDSPFPINLWCGPDLTLIYNDAYTNVLGAKHPEGLGRPGRQVWAEIWPEIEPMFDQVRRGGPPAFHVDAPFTVYRGDLSVGGEPNAWYTFSLSPVRDDDGEIVCFFNIVIETTARILSDRATEAAREEATRARNQAEQANRAKSQFLANMSHEIRTPINAVMGYADLLDVGVAGALNNRQLEFVARIRESSRHLLALVDDILDLSKVEAGEMLVRSEETPLRAVMNSAVQIVAPQAEARGLELKVEHGCGDDPRVIGDEDRIRQVLLNLLSNAVKFTPRGGRITVRCRMYAVADPEAALPDVGPWTVVEVEDTGTGIEPHQLERIFEPFVQADSGHTRRTGGTGLGLSISRRFARLMAGDLIVHSRPGAGSRFMLWLTPAEQMRENALWRQDSVTQHVNAVPVLAELGRALLGRVDQVERDLVERLRADRTVRSARDTSIIDIADHTAALLAIIARTMIALAEGTSDDIVIREGSSLQDVMAAKHGRQRRRIGWARREVEREYSVLHDVLDRCLRDAMAERADDTLDDALAVAHSLLDRVRDVSLSAYDAPD